MQINKINTKEQNPSEYQKTLIYNYLQIKAQLIT